MDKFEEMMMSKQVRARMTSFIDQMAESVLYGGTSSTTATNHTYTLDMLHAAIDKIKALPPLPPPIRFSESVTLTVPGPIEIVARTWRERLFSLPWRPLQATRQVQTYVPDPNVYQLGNGLVVGHPVTIARLRAKLSTQQEG